MSVKVGDLLDALIAQSSALAASDDLPASAATLAQQLLYASRAEPGTAALAEPARQRLRGYARSRAAAGNTSPVLFTRWSSLTGRSVLWNFRQDIWAIAVSPDGNTAYVSVGDGQVFSLTLDSALDSPVQLWRSPDRVTSLELSPDQRHLAAGDGSGNLHVISLDDDGRTVRTLRGAVSHEAAVNRIVWITPGQVVTAGGDGRLIVWQLGDGPPRLAGLRERVSFTCAAYAAGQFFTGDDRGEIWVWALDGTGTDTGTSAGRHWARLSPWPFIADMAISPDGTFLYATSSDGVYRMRVADQSPEPALVGSVGIILSSVAVSPDGANLAVSNTAGAVLLWDAAATDRKPWPVGVQSRRIAGLAWPSSGELVWGSGDGTISSDVPGLAQASASTASPGRLWRLSGTPDGATLLVGTDRGLYRTAANASGCAELELLSEGFVTQVTLIGDGTEALYVANRKVALWNLDGGGGPAPLTGVPEDMPQVTAMAAIPGARAVVVTLGDKANTVQRWDLGRRGDRYAVVMRTLGHHTGGHGRCVAVSPDGDWAVTGNNGLQVRIWPMRSEWRPRAIGFHRARVYSLAIVPESGLIITGDEAGRVAVWEPGGGRLAVELQAAESKGHAVRDIAVNRDSTWVARVSDTGDVRVWSWPLSAGAAPASLNPVFPAWRALALDDGLLFADQGSSLSLLEIANGAETEEAPAADEQVITVIADQWATRRMLRGVHAPHLDYAALRIWLTGSQPAATIFACPLLPSVAGMRRAAQRNGWIIHGLPNDRVDQVAELTRLIRDHSKRRPVVLLSDDATLIRLVADERLDVTVVTELSAAVLE